jgi:hypothetical protein
MHLSHGTVHMLEVFVEDLFPLKMEKVQFWLSASGLG